MGEVELRVTCAAVPTQIEGVAHGKHVYFRERGGHWAFGVGDTEEDAVLHSQIAAGYCREFMTTDDAMALTLQLVKVCVLDGEWEPNLFYI